MSPYVALGELISQPTPLDRGISAEASQFNPIPVRHQGRRDEDRAQGRGQRSRRDEETGPWQYWPICLFRAGPLLSWGWSRTRGAREECEGRAAVFAGASRHTGTEAGRAGCHQAGSREGSRVDGGLERLGEGEGGSFCSKELLSV